MICTPLSGQTMQASVSSKKLSFHYFRITRKQFSGNAGLQLNKDFDYLKLFANQRFALDEPSSFSALELNFAAKPLGKKWYYALSAGLFRNHIKGDFLFSADKVHFGRGNSHVGLCAGASFLLPLSLKNDIYMDFRWQSGFGPHFTRLTAEGKTVSPARWGIRGLGWVNNASVWLGSLGFLRRFSVAAGAVYNFTISDFFRFQVKTVTTGEVQSYSPHFAIHSQRPSLCLKLNFILDPEISSVR